MVLQNWKVSELVLGKIQLGFFLMLVRINRRSVREIYGFCKIGRSGLKEPEKHMFLKYLVLLRITEVKPRLGGSQFEDIVFLLEPQFGVY